MQYSIVRLSIIGPNDSAVSLRDFDIVRDSKGEWSHVRDGSKALLFWGVVRYEDAARNAHETQFCYKYQNNPRAPFPLDGPSEYNKFT